MLINNCIWCGGAASEGHVEHIIPEALGCPSNFVLPGSVVCLKCNNGLAHLDRTVIDEFDFSAFIANVPRKKGKSPVVSSRGNVFGSVHGGKPTMTFNMEKHSVSAHDNSMLAPYRGSNRNIDAKLETEDSISKISFSTSFGSAPKFIRGITKIAFSTLAYFLGAEVARQEQFESVRKFVLNGIGNRHAMMIYSNDNAYKNIAWPPYRHETGHFFVTFRIAYVEFLLDLSPVESLLPTLEAEQLKQFGANGWCVLPLRN
jgi:HNH endonuclease